jgi:hypothetical protein
MGNAPHTDKAARPSLSCSQHSQIRQPASPFPAVNLGCGETHAHLALYALQAMGKLQTTQRYVRTGILLTTYYLLLTTDY